MSPETLTLVKGMLELGAPGVYLLFLIVVWRQAHKDKVLCAEKAEEMTDRYEALLREAVESLTRVAEALDERKEDRRRGERRNGEEGPPPQQG